MNHSNRRGRSRVFAVCAVLAAVAGSSAPAALAQQPRVPKDKKPEVKAPVTPPAAAPGAIRMEDVLRPGKQRDWDLKVMVNVTGYQHTDKDTVVIATIHFATAAVVFPVNKTTGSSKTYVDEVVGTLSFNDREATAPAETKYSENYPCGTRLGRWELKDREGRELTLNLKMPMTCWETVYDDRLAESIAWPGTWPREAVSALAPDAFCDSQNPAIVALVKTWCDGKDPKALKPAVLAKYLTGRVLEYVQINGSAERLNKGGGFQGLELQIASDTAQTRKGTEHDIAIFHCAVLRAAGIPARTVIGYDESDRKGNDKTFLDKSKGARLRSWIEFCLFDEGAAGEVKSVWVPVDVVRMRNSMSKAGSLDKPWKFFGTNEDLETVMPFAFQYHPPAAGVVAHGNPAFWGWFTTPETQIADQSIRFDGAVSSKSADKTRTRKENEMKDKDKKK